MNFIDVFSRRGTGFHTWAKRFKTNIFTVYEKLSLWWSNQISKITLMVSQYAKFLALNNIPVVPTFTEKLSSDPKRKDMLTVVY